MKILSLILSSSFTFFLFTTESFAFNRQKAQRLLQAKNLSLEHFEARGGELMLGEVTGAGLVRNASQIQAVFLGDEVILKREIEDMEFNPNTGILRDLSTFRAQGLFFNREEIQGILIKK